MLRYYIRVMKYSHIIALIGIAFVAAVVVDLALFSHGASVATPSYRTSYQQTPEVSAAVWGIYDANTGETLRAVNEHRVVPVASVTKLMTAAAALLELDIYATTHVTKRAVNEEGRAGKLQAGERMQVRELLFPLLLESSNDAAVALEESAGGEMLLDAMHLQSRELDMYDTEFKDTSGLSSENRSTAYNIAQFVSYLMKHNRHVLDITRLPKYVGENHTWWNNNPVSSVEGYLGGKHGFTEEAGKTVAAVFKQELKEGVEREIAFVLLGSDDLVSDIETLRSYVHNNITYK